jgi:lipopolysaccharide/colanic/teichoic acid biosynthesis glycosyltransferase
MTAKRITDIVLALLGLLFLSPLLLVLALLVAADGSSPFYCGLRVGRGGRDFAMIKLRTMQVNADRIGGTSTAKSDPRVTVLGRFMRRWKFDELPQLWNVLLGDMSFVGPRPNTRSGGVDRYTPSEMRLLEVRPGITDLSSIVFSDESDILEGSTDPDDLYDRLIRPWKSRLGLLYVDRGNIFDDLNIIGLTLTAIIAKPVALKGVGSILEDWHADAELVDVCRRMTVVPIMHAPVVPAE